MARYPFGWPDSNVEGEARFELYDLKNDPSEYNNFANKFPRRVKKLKELYYAWFDDVTEELGKAWKN